MTVSLPAWLLLALAAVIVGVSKTSISGFGSLAVAGFALVLPAKESTAAVLLLLICGDIVALLIYRRHADWGQLRRLLPAVVPGIVIGAVFMGFVSDRVMLVVVAATLIVAVVLQIGLRAHQRRPTVSPPAVAEPTTASPPAAAEPTTARTTSWLPAVLAGLAAGFTTMVANAAGAVMSLYLLAIKADKTRFVATGAWFFFLVNVTKVPFSFGLGLIHGHTLALLASLVPVVLIGTGLGRRFFRRLSQEAFERVTIGASALSALVLLLKGVL